MADKTDAEWKEHDNRLDKLFAFGSFAEAMGFMLRVSYECEKRDHHPEWKNVYNRIWVSLSTHSAGKVTDKDRELAKKMDEIYEQFVK
jgi:4a-hydroxytetrahydrobiopterin dehydratase